MNYDLEVAWKVLRYIVDNGELNPYRVNTLDIFNAKADAVQQCLNDMAECGLLKPVTSDARQSEITILGALLLRLHEDNL